MAFYNIHQTQEVENPVNIAWIGSVNTGIQIPDGLDKCELSLESGIYVVITNSYGNLANGEHQGSISLVADNGIVEALGTIENGTLVLSGGLYSGYNYSRAYKVTMNEVGKLVYSRNYNSGYSTDKDLLTLGVVKIQ